MELCKNNTDILNASEMSTVTGPPKANSSNNCKVTKDIKHPQLATFIVYKIRWFMLFLLVMCSACFALHFTQYSIIAKIVVGYYDISYEAINWSGILFLLLYVPFIFPALHFMDKIDTRTALVINMIGTCAAAWIKVASVAPGRYWLFLLGQTVVSITQVFIAILPARLAASWFGKDETALACGVGVLGLSLGTGAGAILPTILVKSSDYNSSVACDLYTLNTAYAIVCTTFLFLTVAFFKSEPVTPPSGAQKQLQSIDKIVLKKSTIQLFKNPSYVLLLIAYGINIGICLADATLLSQIIVQYYPDGLEDAGIIGLIALLTGMMGNVICGYIMDKSKKYRITTIAVFAFNLLGKIAITIAFFYSITAVYFASSFLGFFMLATYSTGLEVAAEITYPISESTSSGYLLTLAQILGIIFIYFHSYILYTYGAFWANISACIELFISTVLVACMKFNLKRQAAEKLHTTTINETRLL